VLIPMRLGWQYIAVAAVVNAFMTMCYLLGFFFEFTTSSNVLAVAILAPVWAALMSVPALGIRVPRRTVIACIFALAGSVAIGLGFGLGSSTDATQTETYRAIGLSFAVCTGLLAAAQLTMIQSAAMRAPETNMLLAHGFG
jgi:drug/metabolite transporter (DMT)-like permease